MLRGVPSRRGQPYVAAVLLGTALSTFAANTAIAAPATEANGQVLNDLGRYCTACWRNAGLPLDQWCDCTQEVFRRLLERVPMDSWISVLGSDGENHREFLRAIDAVKKRVQRARKLVTLPDGLADKRETGDDQRQELRDAVGEAARHVLSPRQQRIMQLAFEGWTVAETARKLDLSTDCVSDEKYKAVRKLRLHLTSGSQTLLSA